MRIALHPLSVIGGEGTEHETLQALFASKVLAAGAEPVASDEVTRWVAAHGACQNDACLAQLARDTHAARALQLSVSPYSPRIVLSGRLVSQSGAVVRDLSAKSYAKHGSRSVGDAFAAFIKDLDLDSPEPVSLAPSPPVATAPKVEPALTPAPAIPPSAPVTVPTAPIEQTHPTLRMTSYVLAGAGAVALLTGGAVALAARSDRDKLQAMLDGEGNEPPTAEAQQLDQSLASRSHLTTGLVVGGAVAVAGGAALWFLSRPESPKVAVVFGPGSAAFALSGTF